MEEEINLTVDEVYEMAKSCSELKKLIKETPNEEDYILLSHKLNIIKKILDDLIANKDLSILKQFLHSKKRKMIHLCWKENLTNKVKEELENDDKETL